MQLDAANEGLAAAEQRHRVEVDALEQANNQLMLEVVDLKDELEEVSEVIRATYIVYTHTRLSFPRPLSETNLPTSSQLMSQYEENRDTRREVIMEKEITQLQAQLRNTLKERDTIRVTMESMQEVAHSPLPDAGLLSCCLGVNPTTPLSVSL